MLEIICASSIALSINTCQGEKLNPLAIAEKIEIRDVLKQGMPNSDHLAEIIASESEYRREADREGERHEINAPDESREDGIDQAEQRRREIYSEDRIDRDAEQRRREVYSEDRIDRDAAQRRREEYSQEEREWYEERDRSREDYDNEESKSLEDLFEDWFSE